MLANFGNFVVREIGSHLYVPSKPCTQAHTLNAEKGLVTLGICAESAVLISGSHSPITAQ